MRESAFVAIMAVFNPCGWYRLRAPARDGPVDKIALLREERSAELAYRVSMPARLSSLALRVTMHEGGTRLGE